MTKILKLEEFINEQIVNEMGMSVRNTNIQQRMPDLLKKYNLVYNEAYKPVDIVDLDKELEVLWQKIYNSIKRILKMNGYGEEQHLILDNPESSLISKIGTVVLRNDNLFVTFKNNKDRYVFVEDLKDDDFYELYRCVCKTVENLND